MQKVIQTPEGQLKVTLSDAKTIDEAKGGNLEAKIEILEKEARAKGWTLW